jgi:hypothetical protein
MRWAPDRARRGHWHARRLKFEFATDSPLEGDGFELSVPGRRRHPSATANHFFTHHLPPKLGESFAPKASTASRQDPGSFSVYALVNQCSAGSAGSRWRGPRAFRPCATSPRILTKVLPELAPPTGKGCRCLVATSRLAARCSAVIPCDSALPPSLFFGLGLRDTADKASDRQACRDAHPLVSLQPILVWAQKIANLARTRSLVMATVPGGGGNPSIVA